MLLKRLRRATPYYSLIQGLYWAVFCMTLAFASVYLLDKGFTNSQIGLILGLSYLFSAVFQPIIGSVFSRYGLKLNIGIAAVYAAMAVLTICILVLPLGKIPFSIIIIGIFTMQSMLQPSIYALHQSMETKNDRINFGLARGVGSVAYALSSFLTGQLLVILSSSYLPFLYLVIEAALAAVLLGAKTTSQKDSESVQIRKVSYLQILREHHDLIFFVTGMCSLFLTYSFIDSFLVQIIVSKGGTSANLGTAIFMSVMTELPAMLIFAYIVRKGKGIRVFLISIWIWLAKDILTFLAPSVPVLYLVQMMNFGSCAIYVPGMMNYMQHRLPPQQLLRGVTMAGTSTTLGSLIATVFGGWLMDAAGVTSALGLVQLFAITGTVLLTVALSRSVKYDSPVR